MIDNFRLVEDPDPLLYKKLNELDINSNFDLKLIETAMINLMLEHNGIGISANQVGFDKRVIVIKPQQNKPFALFNPRITSQSEDQILDKEGCLSFLGLFLPVYRSTKVVVEYIDSNKKSCIIELKDYDARCLQHEMDHLDGICFTSKVSQLKLNLARKKQRKLEHGRAQ